MLRNFIFFLGFSFILTYQLSGQEAGYSIKITLDAIDDHQLYLTGNLGPKEYIFDSAKVRKNNTVLFENKNRVLPGGIYRVVSPKGIVYLDFIVDRDRYFSISATKEEPWKSAVINGSDENITYYQFLKLWHSAGELPLAYIDEITGTSPGSLLAKYLKAKYIPFHYDPVYMPDGITRDTAAEYQYITTHFFDHMDMADPRMLRIPVDWQVGVFFTRVVRQEADSIIREMDRFMAKVKNKEMENYFLRYFYQIFDVGNPEYDAVLVHLYDRYCPENQCEWLDDYSGRRLYREVQRKRKLLPGQSVPVLAAYDREHRLHSTEDIKDKHILLWFWDPDCDDCVELTPVLHDIYKDYRDEVEVFAVSVTEDYDRWIRLVDEHQWDWINVSYANGEPNYDFVDYFELYTTPGIYLLNKHHKIIARQFPLEQLPGKLEY